MELKFDGKFYLKVAVMFLIMIVFWNMPPFGQITPMGMRILGIFIAVIYGWISLDIIWPSMIGFVAYSLTGYTTLMQALMTAFSNQTVVLVLISSILAGVIERTNCIVVLNKWLLTGKFVQKSPWFLVAAILLVSIIASICNCGFAAIFVTWTLVLQIADLCGYERKGAFVSFMLTMVVIFNVTTGNAFPWKGGSLACLAFFEPIVGPFEYFPYIVMSFAYLAVLFVMVLLIAKFIFRLDVSKLRLDDEVLNQLKAVKINSVQKITLFLIAAFITAMLLPTFLPKTWGITILLNRLGLPGIAIIVMFIFAILRNTDGKPVLSLDAAHQSIPWTVVWILGFALPFASAIQSADCGIMATIMQIFTPLFSGMNLYVFMYIALFFLGFLTQVSNNVVLLALFTPIFMPICVQLGGNPYVMFLMMLHVANCAYLTPAASMQGALIHGHEAVGKKYVYPYALCALLVSIIFLPIIFVPLGHLFW